MKITKYFLTIALIFSSVPAHAKIIALGSLYKKEHFKEFLVKNPEYSSLTQHTLQNRINKNDILIEKKYKLAIKSLALADLKPSVFLFKEIIEYPNRFFVFSDSKIELISESFYRLANLDRANDDYWIKQGVINNPIYKPASMTFNPIIMKKYNTAKEDHYSYFYKLDIENIKPKWSKLFVNSKKVSDDILVYPSGRYTLQIFKEGHLPHYKKLSGSELIKMKKPNLKKYNLGTCQNPKFYEPTLKMHVDAVFYSKNCIAKKNDTKLAEKNNTKLARKTDTQLAKNLSKSVPPLYLNDPIKPSSLNTKKNTLFSNKKTWYYLVGGIVLTSLAIGLSHQSNDKKIQPVQHD